MRFENSQRRLATLAGALLLTAAACATEGRAPHAGIARLWHDYRAMADERALAIAGDPNGVWVGAAASGSASRVEAEQAALAECRKRRAARRLQPACRLYASGDEVVWDR